MNTVSCPHRSEISRYTSTDATWRADITGAAKLPLHSGTVVVYTVEVQSPDGQRFAVTQRYSQFEQLQAAVREFFERQHQQFVSNLPSLGRKAWAWKDQLSVEFISARRDQLQFYLDRLLGLPHAIECPALVEFLTGQRPNSTGLTSS